MDWIAPLIALTCMEIVLGIDNIIFIAILAARLPESQQGKARNLGLLAALVTRLVLLASVKWIMSAEDPLFSLTDVGFPAEWLPDPDPPAVAAAHESVAGEGDHSRPHVDPFKAANEVSLRDLILLGGGLFLIWKSVREVHHKIAGDAEAKSDDGKPVTFSSVIMQIMVLDVVFSLDSVITAVGMADEIWVMMTAVVVAVGFMLLAAGAISRFVERHPTVKILALSFLILIGFTLVVEGLGVHVSKAYVYFAMVFGLGVELLNMRVRTRIKPNLKQTPPGTIDPVRG